MRESGGTSRALLACAVLTKQALHGRGTDVVLLGKDTDGAASTVGRDQILDIC
ncbi:MAG: hypothetical protein WKF73_18110 [Nocardioidaceae bacterium]